MPSGAFIGIKEGEWNTGGRDPNAGKLTTLTTIDSMGVYYQMFFFLFMPSNRSGSSLHPLWLSCFQMLNWLNINFKNFLVLTQIDLPKFQ